MTAALMVVGGLALGFADKPIGLAAGCIVGGFLLTVVGMFADSMS